MTLSEARAQDWSRRKTRLTRGWWLSPPSASNQRLHWTGHRKLFPVRLLDFETLRDWECFDADSGKDLTVELREYFIPDFSHWKEHDQFEAAFSRLLKDLRAENTPAQA